jgi:RNA polymerase sigma factor (sigma-70 family)
MSVRLARFGDRQLPKSWKIRGVPNWRIMVVIDQVVETDFGAGKELSQRRYADPDDLAQVVIEARAGSSEAWNTLIQRFGGLVAAIARRCRLNDADVAEVSQTTWLRLIENIDRIQQPERLGAWLATTSRRESLRIATRRTVVSDTDAMYLMADDDLDPLDHEILKEEQVRAIRLAAEKLPPRCQRLLGLLMGDEDLPYTEIAEQLSMPIGSIGPTRGRCLEHLRQLLEEVELSHTAVAR